MSKSSIAWRRTAVRLKTTRSLHKVNGNWSFQTLLPKKETANSTVRWIWEQLLKSLWRGSQVGQQSVTPMINLTIPYLNLPCNSKFSSSFHFTFALWDDFKEEWSSHERVVRELPPDEAKTRPQWDYEVRGRCLATARVLKDLKHHRVCL